ncbi:intermembrane phospholipid transport protein YdbH family protein [Marinobacterium sp. YM272]|uniref:intermembrane phospholipid transport protein YdbH family protein n=1 Tax=Marinobacterium sp. YM272 TaxID=3421654 RepID=UPI003D7FF871
MRKRKLLWILLPLPLLLLAAYLALPYLARNLIEDWLAGQGFDQPRIELTHPGWQRLDVPHLSLIQRSGERSISLQSDNISIYFDPVDLLLRQRIDEIRIPELTITIRAERSLERRIESAGIETFNLNDYPAALIFHYAPSRRLVIGQFHVDYQAPDQPQVRAAGNLDLTPSALLSWARLELLDDAENSLAAPLYLDLRFNPQQQIELNLVSNNQPLLTSSGELISNADDWGLNLESRLNLKPLLDFLHPLVPPLPLSGEDFSGQLDTRLSSRWPAQMPLDAQTLVQQTRADLNLNLQAQGRQLVLPQQVEIDTAEVNAAAEISLQENQLQLRITPQTRMQLTRVSQQQLRLDTAELSLRQAVELLQPLPVADNHSGVRLSPLELRLTPTGISLPGLDSLETSPVELSLGYNPASTDLSYHLRSERISAALSGRQLPAFSAELTGGTAADGQRGRLILASPRPALSLSADWLLAAQDFRADWRTRSVNLPPLLPELRRWIDAWPVDLAFTHGTLDAKGYLQGPSPADASLYADLSLRNLAFAWDTYVETDNVSADLQLRRSRNGSLTSAGEIRSDLLRTGIDLHDTAVSYRYTQPVNAEPRLELAPINQAVFGGTVSLPAFAFNPLDPDFSVSAQLTGIELSEILTLYQQPGLAGDTALNGTLPIRVKGSEISVSGGQVHSASPGWLRYQPSSALSSTAQNNPALQLALSALEDLQIEALDLGVNYAPDGSLELNSRLRGHNPDWQQGRPIDLSLNVEENLLALFKSLQLSEKIGESLRKNLENQSGSAQ